MVEANYNASTGFAVTGISEMEFQIQSTTGEFHMVNLHAGTCTCTSFQQLRIPCKHVVAAAGRAGMATEAMVAAAYFADTWHSAYEAKIYPIPSVGRTQIGETYAESLLPPPLSVLQEDPGSSVSFQSAKISDPATCYQENAVGAGEKAITRPPAVIQYE
ncbi:hypothetical protein Rs2_02615 [Raphanus sativus]|nr:hypothetical protein Rs2_02615 [Raphanus sativus]